jgi:dihydrofolate reductase
MARLIYSNIQSLDGYIADEDGKFDWAEPDEEVHTFANDLERSVGTYLYGRRLYEARTGNRQLNAAIHRVAVTQKRMYGPARAYLERRTTGGNTSTEALRALKRKLSDVVYRALVADAAMPVAAAVGEAA